MNKLIFRKFFYDVFSFFLIASLCITIIIWVVQAVNYLDIVSEDGHGLKTYFIYTVLNLPKIFSRTIIFVFFISIFYNLNKYEGTNEILVLWNNGISKLSFINFLLKYSILFIIIQIIFNLYIVPNSQNLGRTYLKNSNIDFLPKLISEKKFIDVAKNLTIFIEEYKANGEFENIYIKEIIDNENSKIITSNSGNIVKKNNKYFLKLKDGGITNIENYNTYSINFLSTEYDLSKFSTKTVTERKIQETDSPSLFRCLKTIYMDDKNNKKYNELCNEQSVVQVSQEMYKRIIIPLYILIISLIASSLIIKPKKNLLSKFYRTNIFIIGVTFIMLSQISVKFIDATYKTDILITLMPIIFVLTYYFVLLLKNKFNLRTL